MRPIYLVIVCLILHGCAPIDSSSRSPWPKTEATSTQDTGDLTKSTGSAPMSEPAADIEPLKPVPKETTAAVEPVTAPESKAETFPQGLLYHDLAAWLKTPDANGDQPLFRWARADRTDLVEALTKQLDRRSRNRWVLPLTPDASLRTPLHDALSWQMVDQLLNLGFQIAVRDVNRQTPMHSAARGERVSALARMVTEVCSEHPVIGWFVGDAIDLVRRQFIAENPLNWRDTTGMTPLLIAATAGRATMVASLLKCSSVRLDLTDPAGRNALHLAAMAPDSDALVALLHIGSEARRDGPQSFDLDTPDLKGDTALALARRAGRTVTVDLLKAAGAR